MKHPSIATPAITTIVDSLSSASVGQLAFQVQTWFPYKTSYFSKWIQFCIWMSKWREKRDSNPQPTVLETGALPIELFSQMVKGGDTSFTPDYDISVILPAPIVFPPSRIANL